MTRLKKSTGVMLSFLYFPLKHRRQVPLYRLFHLRCYPQEQFLSKEEFFIGTTLEKVGFYLPIQGSDMRVHDESFHQT